MMKLFKFKLGLALAVCCAAATSLLAATQGKDLLVSKHLANGVKCEDCHNAAKPSAPAQVDACLNCHGGYEGMAKRTRKVEKGPHVYLANINPHESHIGNVECTQCHTLHNEQKKSFCDRCHTFEFDAHRKPR